MSQKMIEKKPSLDNLTELTHHGVKGMRWGVRQRATRGQIRTARKSVRKDARAHLKEQAKFVVGKSSKQKLHETRLTFLKNPNRPTALRLTRGETAALAVLASPASIAAFQIQSRLVESRQRDGYLRPDGSGKIRRLTN